MNIFQKAMIDIFNNNDFTEEFIIDNEVYTCIVSPLINNFEYSDGGLVSTENFTLDVKLPLNNIPKKNDKLYFRGNKYKINYIQVDSANASMKLYIVALSKGV